MSAQDKTIKVTVASDGNSLGKLKREITEVLGEAQKLVETFNKLGNAFGGGAHFSTLAGRSGGSALPQMRQQQGAQQGGITGNITQAVQSSAALFKGAAAGSKDAFTLMTGALKEHVRASDQEIRRLQSSLQGLERTYERLAKRQASGLGGGLTDSAMGQAQNRYLLTAQALADAQKKRGVLGQQSLELEAAGNPTMGQRFRTAMGMPAVAQPGQQGPLGTMMSTVAGKMGLPVGALGLGGAVAAGIAIASNLARNTPVNYSSNIQYGIDKPFFGLAGAASVGQIHGGNALSIRHGDMARVAAMVRLAGDPASSSILGSDYLLSQRRKMDNPDTLIGQMFKNGIMSGTKSYLGSKFGGLAGGSQLNAADRAAGIGSTDVMGLARQRADQEQMALKAEQYQKALDMKLAEDPGFNDRINSFYSGALGRTQLLRAGGMGGGNVRIGSKRFGYTMSDQFSQLKAQALDMGYSEGDLVGAMQEMSGAAGRGNMHRGTAALLGAKAGGLGNASSIIGTGAQFNGGFKGGMGLLGAVQGMIGRGGTDITAAQSLTGLGGSMMTSGNFSGGGAGLMTTLLGAGYGGGDAAEDMRLARVTGAGVGAIGNVMAGGVDPLQQALNASAALQAAPNAPYSAKYALQHMDPASRAEFERTGKVPSHMAAMGVTDTMISKYISVQTGTSLSRISGSMVGGPAGAAVARFKKSGGFEYMRGMKKDQREAEIKALAPALQMAGGAGSLEAAEGSIRFQMAAAGILKPGRGKGSHDPYDTRTATAKANTAAAIQTSMEGQQHAAAGHLYGETFDKAPEMQVGSDVTRKISQKGIASGDVGTAIDNVSKALDAFVASIRGELHGAAPGVKAGAR